MARYVDGFVIPVPKDKLDKYQALAKTASEVWKEHGALEYIETIADDVPMGELTSFPRSVQANPDEIVVFAYIVYKSREHRDQVNAAAMEDPRISCFDMKDSPFDTKRMIWGGFKSFIEA